MVAVSRTFPLVASNNGRVTQAPTPINGGTAPAPVGVLHHMGAAVIASKYAVKTKSVCEHQKNSVSDPELSSFISDIQKVCNINYLGIVYVTGLPMSVLI